MFESVFDGLPGTVRARFDDVPVVLDDAPDAATLAACQCEADDLCGLHTGVPLTERSVDDQPMLPDVIHLFRQGIIAMAGGWTMQVDDEGHVHGGPGSVREEIRITLLHELGHHFGLDEDDLERLGYG